MIRKSLITILLIGAAAGSLYAANQKDTTSASKAPAITQQAVNSTLAKQTRILPRPQSNLSKIKELFM